MVKKERKITKRIPKNGKLMSPRQFEKYRTESAEGLREFIRREGIARMKGYAHAGCYVLDANALDRDTDYGEIN